MRVLKVIALAVLAMLPSLFFTPLEAGAETLTWFFRSEHPNVVSVEFYSKTRRGHVWPGNQNVYLLKDDAEHSFRLSCRGGEKICYGAWVRNRTHSYWGVGYNSRYGCEDCCYTCGAGDTKTIILKP